jgi:hypothetical protein
MEVRGTWEVDGAIVRMMDGRMVLGGTADVPIGCRAPAGSTAIEVVVPVEIVPGDTIAVRVSQPGKVVESMKMRALPATLSAIREDLAQGVYEHHHGNMDTHRLVGDMLDVLIERDRMKASVKPTASEPLPGLFLRRVRDAFWLGEVGTTVDENWRIAWETKISAPGATGQGHTPGGVDPDLIAVYGGSRRDNERGLREARAGCGNRFGERR